LLGSIETTAAVAVAGAWAPHAATATMTHVDSDLRRPPSFLRG
jgi:hypothetical protein